MENNIKLICGNCLEEMKKTSNGSVDLIFTDPPYGIANEVKITRGRKHMKFKGKDISHDFGEWDKFASTDEFMKWTFLWVKEAVRMLRKGGMFVSYFDRDKINFLSQILQQAGFKTKGYYADCKSNPVPQARKVKWMNGWEIVGLWQKIGGDLTFNYKLGQHEDWGVRPVVGGIERYEHPTQKSLLVAKLFIQYWSNKGDLVCDPFMGTGTNGAACKELNRRFNGIEIDKKYFEIAEKRIANTMGSMF